MKVAIINSFYYPNMVGGTEHSVKILAEELQGCGVDVLVLSADGFCCDDDAVQQSVSVQRISHKWFTADIFLGKKGFIRRLYSMVKTMYCRDSYNAVLSILEDWKPDVIHSNGLYGLSPLVWKAARHFDIPVVHTLRDYYLLDPKSVMDATPRWLEGIYETYMRYMTSRYVNCVTAPSAKTIEIHQTHGFFKNCEKIRIPNCIQFDVERFKQSIDTHASRAVTSKYLFIGALAKHKGIDILLAEFSNCPDPSISLHIAGSGPLESYVLKSAQDDSRIIFHGQLDSISLERLYEDCDVLIVPSVWDEPFGRVVIEGFLHGLPCIGTMRGGVAEILEESSGGVIVDVNKKGELQNAITMFLNRNLVNKCLKSIDTSMEGYSSLCQAKAFIDVYKKCK